MRPSVAESALFWSIRLLRKRSEQNSAIHTSVHNARERIKIKFNFNCSWIRFCHSSRCGSSSNELAITFQQKFEIPEKHRN